MQPRRSQRRAIEPLWLRATRSRLPQDLRRSSARASASRALERLVQTGCSSTECVSDKISSDFLELTASLTLGPDDPTQMHVARPREPEPHSRLTYPATRLRDRLALVVELAYGCEHTRVVARSGGRHTSSVPRHERSHCAKSVSGANCGCLVAQSHKVWEATALSRTTALAPDKRKSAAAHPRGALSLRDAQVVADTAELVRRGQPDHGVSAWEVLRADG